ncbi:TetR/AcrR family transcriptional regulator C-terminal ligand-binding domain-containing protein [Octadecabacter sp. R77987]|uniref:TetR/AcrR family transcriptional regulator C-terminal ligand-binding domain-containing protein n=1 Tax=Octadecabacter sp. R77987 TaxID=3093874 RepID=UPI00366BAB29
MNKLADPRLDATQTRALEAALHLLETEGVLAVTHGAINRETGISRSTLYRHWPKLDDLRNAAFARATQSGKSPKPTDGPLRADLEWILGTLVSALNDTPWGKIAPQVIGTAAIDGQTRELLEKWNRDRRANVRSAFDLALERGEISDEAPVEQLIEIAISVPYFRKLMSGKPLDQAWFDAHIDLICNAAGTCK